ncbi:MAG: hypothetical protein M0010_03705 [Actinomycetota bacterium]|nr:hypothetical protein [Actinomycetota bacterium]
MPDVLGKHGLKVAAAEDEHPVEALAPHGAHDTLADGVRPRCPDRGFDDPGALGGEDGIEGGGELDVAIADEELDRARLVSELHREVGGTLGLSAVTHAAAGSAVMPAIRTRRLS